MNQIQQLPKTPNLYIAPEYEKWRMECLGISGISRQIIAEHLIATKSEIGMVRATLVLGVELCNFEIAYKLAGQLICSQDSVIQLYGWYQTAFLTILKGYSNDPNAPLTAKTTIPTLQQVLTKLESLSERNLLSLELEMRVHASLCEANIMIEEFNVAYLHASKMSLLAPIIGLKTYQYSSQSLTALCLMYLGETKSALNMMNKAYQNEENKSFRTHLSIDMSHLLYFSGDFYAALQLADQHKIDNPDYEVHFQSIFAWTLLRKPEYIQLDKETNRSASLTRACQYLANGLRLPHTSVERSTCFRDARFACHDITLSSKTWATDFEHILWALCSLLAGDYGLVQSHLPSLEKIKSFPLWVQILGLAVTVELCICYRRTQSQALLIESLLELNQILNVTEIKLLKQISIALQLLTPHALACLSIIGNTQDIIISHGQDVILNVKNRPIRVYNTGGLRPLQAAEFSLASFGIPFLSSRMGGGQIDLLTKCLRRNYGENDYWFKPVSPCRLVVALLQASEQTPIHREMLLFAAKGVYSSHGLLPQLPANVHNPALTAIEKIVLQLLAEKVKVQTVWQVIESFGGNL
jgi:hypothetical protein